MVRQKLEMSLHRSDNKKKTKRADDVLELRPKNILDFFSFFCAKQDYFYCKAMWEAHILHYKFLVMTFWMKINESYVI